MKLDHRFIKNAPDELEEGILYISLEYGNVMHKCACGCGNEVNTPLSPVDWQLLYDGKTISLYPSIGNWNFPCQSHYWITNGEVEWAPKWTKEKIERERKRDQLLRTQATTKTDSWNIFKFISRKKRKK
jgi:hypothetical protein